MNELAGAGEDDDLPVVNQPFMFFRGLRQDAIEIRRDSRLLRPLVERELRQRYKGSIFGWTWALARPLAMLFIYGIAVGVFLGAGRQIPQYAIYIYSGIIAWQYFAGVLSGTVNTFKVNSGLIKKVAFRKEYLACAVVVVGSVDLAIQMVPLILAYILFATWPSVGGLAPMAAAIPLAALLAVGLGLLVAAGSVRFKDLSYFLEVVLQVGFWSVPIVYTYGMVANSLSSTPIIVDLYTWNPLLVVVNTFRQSLWPPAHSSIGAGMLLPSEIVPMLMGGAFFISLLLMWVGQRLFSRAAPNFAENL